MEVLTVMFCGFFSGGGFESEANYSQWRRVHKPLERYGSLHDSVSKLLEGKIIL